MNIIDLKVAKTSTLKPLQKYGSKTVRILWLWFAWVDVKVFGKKLNYSKVWFKEYGSGVSLWNPSGNITQDMDKIC